jgi:hypothetical protein
MKQYVSLVSKATVAAALLFNLVSYTSLQRQFAVGFDCGTSPSVGESDPRCQEALDDLDAVFDRMRAARIHYMVNNPREVRNSRLVYDPFEPEAVCALDERFGGEGRYGQFGDGPKFVCAVDLLKEEKGDCLVYSVGSYNEIAFERAVNHTLGCEIHTFDPTLDKPFVGGMYATFHPWGFGKEKEQTQVKQWQFESRSLVGVMTALNHTNRTLDIFKIDCEGCEHVAVLEAFEAIAAGLVKIDQIQVEMHGGNRTSLKKLFEAADKADMRVFHKERNHWGCEGWRCLEYAFVSKSYLRRANAMAMGCPYEK